MPPVTTNNLYMNFIYDNYSSSTLVFNDGLVTSFRAGYAFFIPDLYIQSFANLVPQVFSFTGEGSNIFRATVCIGALTTLNTVVILPSCPVRFIRKHILFEVFSINIKNSLCSSVAEV